MIPVEQVDARKMRFNEAAALELAEGVDEIYSARAGKVTHLKVGRRNRIADELGPLLLGPTGNLRAPVLRVGRTLVVGFDEALYRGVFGV